MINTDRTTVKQNSLSFNMTRQLWLSYKIKRKNYLRRNHHWYIAAVIRFMGGNYRKEIPNKHCDRIVKDMISDNEFNLLLFYYKICKQICCIFKTWIKHDKEIVFLKWFYFLNNMIYNSQICSTLWENTRDAIPVYGIH